MDIFCVTYSFLTISWNQTRNYPRVNIYCSDMWEDNFVPRIYDIYDLFLGSLYHKIFKADAPVFLVRARALISLHGDWYVREYFSYFRIWGSKTVHLLPIIVPDRMVLQEFSFQTFIDGTHPKLAKKKRKSWPKFPLHIDSLVIQNSIHANLLGKGITTMKLGEAGKRFYDPKAFLAILFSQVKGKFNYTHEYFPDDLM